MNIPEVSDERLSQVLANVRPMVLDAQGRPCTFASVDPRRVSFIWDPRDLAPVVGIVPTRTIRTLHTFGHPALFKPSIAEAVAQLPADLTGVVGFTILRGPEDADDLNAEREALHAGYHVATVALWERV